MKICVTGGAGMIGSALVRRLAKSNIEICVIDNLWRGKLSNLKSIEGFNIETDFHDIDLSKIENQDAVTAIFADCDVVIHLADIVAGIGYVFNNQYEIFKVNNLINTFTFSACVQAEVKKILYAGTACSFPQELQMGLESVLFEKNMFPANPESAYGWSKLWGTLELRYLTEKHKISATTLVLHNVYGSFCDLSERSQVIPSLINRVIDIENDGTLSVWGSGNQGRAFISTHDVADAFYKAIYKENLPELIQIGPSVCTSIKELTQAIVSISGKSIKVFYDTTKPEGDIGRCANYETAKKILEWTPQTNFYEGLKEVYSWIQHAKK
jgi:GDP-D-mannose 3', 5'-epimerase